LENIAILTFFGYTDKKRGEKEVIEMQRLGKLISPISLIEEKTIEKLFDCESDIIYFFIDKNLIIKDVLIPVKKEELEKWIRKMAKISLKH
jgi:hypothetical protein